MHRVNRGPDRGHVRHESNAVLAHRRLSIIDLLEIADQPMTNEDGTIRVVFNMS
jgi:asparagine synthase (glutamine-hydrolysing)